MSDNMLQPMDDQNSPVVVMEQMGRMLGQMEQLLQGVMTALSMTNKRMEQLEREVRQLTPLTGAQEKALGERIKQRAEELREDYKLPASSTTAIANAIRKDLKLAGGVRAVRELPRVEYPVYLERVAIWDDFAAMRAIKKKSKSVKETK